MIRHQHRPWKTYVVVIAILASMAACSKKKPDSNIETVAENQTLSLTAAEKYIKQQEEDKHAADYYKVDNQQRVVVEDSLIDDVNASVGDVSANAEKARLTALQADAAAAKKSH